MKKLLVLLMVLSLGLMGCTGATVSTDEQQVDKTLNNYSKALIQHDLPLLESVINDPITFGTLQFPVVIPRVDYLDHVQWDREDYSIVYEIHRFKNRITVLNGDEAVVEAIEHHKITSGWEDEWSVQIHLSKSSGKWLITHIYNTSHN